MPGKLMVLLLGLCLLFQSFLNLKPKENGDITLSGYADSISAKFNLNVQKKQITISIYNYRTSPIFIDTAGFTTFYLFYPNDTVFYMSNDPQDINNWHQTFKLHKVKAGDSISFKWPFEEEAIVDNKDPKEVSFRFCYLKATNELLKDYTVAKTLINDTINVEPPSWELHKYRSSFEMSNSRSAIAPANWH